MNKAATISHSHIRAKHTAVVAFLLAVVTFAVFFSVIRHDFVNFDDPDYITQNPQVQAGLTWGGMRWALGTWHPVTWISLMVDVEMYGTGPGGFHFVNLLWHIGSTVVLLILLSNLTGFLWRSAFVAALFALHPLQVETVAWVAERKGVLSTFFALLTLWAYSRYVRCDALNSKFRIRYYLLALSFFVLGLMSKPMLVTLPCLMLLLDFWPLRRVEAQSHRAISCTVASLIREKIPFVLLSVIASVATVLFQREAGVLQTLSGYSARSRVENALIAYPHYLGKLFWPVDLATPYPRMSHWPPASVALSLLLVAALCYFAIRFARRMPGIFTGWYWFLGLLLPVLGFVQVGAQSVADRYVYLPCVGLFVVVTWIACEASSRWQVPKFTLGVAATMVLLACATRTHNQLSFWKDAESLCQHTIAVTQDNWLAHQLLGTYYSSHGRRDEAMRHFRITSQIKPNYADPWNGMGCLFADKGDLTNAISCFEAALRAKPDLTEARYNLARALAMGGKRGEAIEQYAQVLEQKPEFALAHGDLGLLLAQQRQFDEAIRHLQAAVGFAPTNTVFVRNLGNVLLGAGKLEKAIPLLRDALRLSPNNLETHNTLASVLAATGQLDEAVAHFRAILRARPDSPAAHFNLGKALATQNRTSEAVQHFREAVRLDPSFAAASSELQKLESSKD